MNARPAFPCEWRPAAVLVGLALLAFTPLRSSMESSMVLHMLLQFPLVVLAGYLLAGELAPRTVERLQQWNAYGLAGLLATALLMALLMIPRLLDLALVDLRFEIAKWVALLATGAALRLSWGKSGLLGQFFFLGNMLPMTAMAGFLFIESPLRVCNAYLLDDQVRVGQGLLVACVGVSIAWLAHVTRRLAAAAEAERAAGESERAPARLNA